MKEEEEEKKGEWDRSGKERERMDKGDFWNLLCKVQAHIFKTWARFLHFRGQIEKSVNSYFRITKECETGVMKKKKIMKRKA